MPLLPLWIFKTCCKSNIYIYISVRSVAGNRNYDSIELIQKQVFNEPNSIQEATILSLGHFHSKFHRLLEAKKN